MMGTTDHTHNNRAVGTPLVSVIIPAYNTAAFIAEALESVFRQTLSDFEVIVINDGSSDTKEFERELSPYLDRIVYIKQENRGASAARNVGIYRAGGEYIAFLDSDDIWFPQYLKSQMRLFQQNPPPDFVYTDGLVFGGTLFTGKRMMELYPSNGAVTFESLIIEKCTVSTPGVIARKQVLIDAGLFDENISHAEDFDLWLRVAHRGARMMYQRQVLWKCRSRSGSLSSRADEMLAGEAAVLIKLDEALPLDPRTRLLMRRRVARAKAQFELECGKRRLLERRFEEAQRSFTSANTYLRSNKLRFVLVGIKCAPSFTRWAAGVWNQVLLILRVKCRNAGLPQTGRQ
jgi:glycosyltransferase involved in cell wall biosynthesis